ncbi:MULTISPECIES: peroxiredoxin-like family protein [unclassified Photobacterium]|uniref:peroxiredoxin-like family protein n=1 Tax=unclassified Photobacterium TaxID=2628852 RepID=UPI001B8BDFA5|nr:MULTISPECIES: peroxiredoxin-like family protein [unclassified Photobacterium]MDO6708535.1 peroxiredoxin-like family protein [Photobacterium sp. 1_MG-2023]QUJ69997.1 AhpC/TSA family protein [Photobacterium sp. GJ3]
MALNQPQPGTPFPSIPVQLRSGQSISLGTPAQGADWRLVVIYRGKHCPLCTRYLNQLETLKADLAEIGVDIIAASMDSQAQLEAHLEALDVSFPIAYGLTIAQAQSLGLYLSEPRSAQETDHVFAEPGLFVINAEGKIQIADYSNIPFARPDLKTLVAGLQWLRTPENNYPVRGTYQG